MGYYNIDSADGNSITQGIQSEGEARRIAQRMANERGASVYLYEVGGAGDGGESEIESEEVAPRWSDAADDDLRAILDRCSVRHPSDDEATDSYATIYLVMTDVVLGRTTECVVDADESTRSAFARWCNDHAAMASALYDAACGNAEAEADANVWTAAARKALGGT